MKKFFFLPILILLCACSPTVDKHTTFAMDTVMDFTVYGSHITPILVETVDKYDALFSPTAANSTLSAYNRGEAVDDPTFNKVLEDALNYYDKTSGAFDPSLGNIIDLWRGGKVPENDALYSAVIGVSNLQNGAKLNLSAIAKGALSDAILADLNRTAAESAIVSLGGNILAFGEKPDGKPWIVGIRDPEGDANSFLATVAVRDKFVVSSGDYERFFEQDGKRYHHILDASTRYPAENTLRGVTIIADSGTLADAYSTALFVMGYEKALEFWKASSDFEAIFVFDDKVIVTEGISDFKLTNEGYTYEVARR